MPVKKAAAKSAGPKHVNIMRNANGIPYLNCTINGIIAAASGEDYVVLTDQAGSFENAVFLLQSPGTRDMLATLLAAISTQSTVAAAADTATYICYAVWLYPANA